jgi:hypothetical protein
MARGAIDFIEAFNLENVDLALRRGLRVGYPKPHVAGTRPRD